MNYGTLLATLRDMPEVERVAAISRMPEIVFSDGFSAFVIDCVETGEKQLATDGGMARFLNKINRYLPGVGWLGMRYFVQKHHENVAVLQTMAEVNAAYQATTQPQPQAVQRKNRSYHTSSPPQVTGRKSTPRPSATASPRNYNDSARQSQIGAARQDDIQRSNIEYGNHLHEVRRDHYEYTTQQDDYTAEHHDYNRYQDDW